MRIIQDITHRIYAFVKITHIYAECLLTHRTLIAVSRRLIVVAEWDINAEDTVHQARMNFAVGVKRRQSSPFNTLFQIGRECSEHRRIDFVAIHIFNKPLFVQILLRVVLIFRDFVRDYEVIKVLVRNILLPTNALSPQYSSNPQFTLICRWVNIHNIERSIHSPRFRANDNTRLLDIPYNRGHRVYDAATLVMLQG